MKSADPFYQSKRWEMMRSSILRRDKYQCQWCKLHGLMRSAECVHHVFPRDQYNEYQWQPWNLKSLCSKCHDKMHNRFTGQLSKEGKQYQRIVAHQNNIVMNSKNQKILVIGLRGSGKSTYCRNHLDGESLCYDMDAIASAFRLRMPHDEYFRPARKMANDFLGGFLSKAHEYCPKLYIIRTAPGIKEVQNIDPDKIVICKHEYIFREMDDREAAKKRIEEVENWCRVSGIECEVID